MSDAFTRVTVAVRRSNRSLAMSRAILGTIVLAVGVGIACAKQSTYLCQRQLVNSARTQITPLTDKSYEAKSEADAESDCIADSQSGVGDGRKAECSCAAASSKSRVAPTAPIAP